MNNVLLRRQSQPGRHRPAAERFGFTMVEMLVVITILLLLMSITIYSVNYARDSERVSGAAGKVQSFLSGARDRAIYNRKPIGVRFFLDSDDDPGAGTGQRRTVSAMYYIDPGQLWSDGAVRLHRWDPDFNGRTNFPSSGNNPDINGDGVPDNPGLIWMVAGLKENKWWELKRRGLLVDGIRIRIPAGPTGTWYTVDTRFIDITAPPPLTQYLVLQIPYADPGDTDVRRSDAFELGGPENYELELPASILPNEPALMPDGVVIDLDGSRLPLAWRPSALNGANFSQFMDIVFSPRGNVIGAPASAGVIHLYVCDQIDATILKDEYISHLPGATLVARLVDFETKVRSGVGNFVPADEIDSGVVANSWNSGLSDPGEPFLPKDRRLVTLFTQTGSITVNMINPTDVFDPFDLDGDST
ncbi:MAG: prepilin-type N-terminal cleavage/methylation domain-containing protein, partial [Planctomycetaceae bacterium]|nr:prepilin-type N-terminal cleavage/methylation domain-containing protein [Planctomycetaceae bacterium]